MLPILIYCSVGGAAVFVLALFFHGPVHTHPEGEEPVKHVTDTIEDIGYSNWKSNLVTTLESEGVKN